jgi:secondary thiamine-phosphate synthase enzyme
MFESVAIAARGDAGWQASPYSLHLQTVECMQFIDITEAVIERVRQSGVRHGLVNVQTKHTTTAVIVNEYEPLLLEDMKRTLERLAPQQGAYRHNDFSIRTANLTPDEQENGHSHCKALFLRTSETLNIADGAIQLGRWQRIFLIELDSARKRTVSIMIMGQ